MINKLGKISFLLAVLTVPALSLECIADPARGCSEFDAQIKEEKRQMEHARSDKMGESMRLAEAYQSCFVALESLKQQENELRRAHPDPADRSVQAALEALRGQIASKTADCDLKLEAQQQFEAALAPYLERLQSETDSAIQAINRRALVQGCTHPCLNQPGYCNSDAPTTGLIARGRRDLTNTGVVGFLFGSCQYRVELALGTPYAVREEYCQEYYNVPPESVEHIHQVCAGLQNGRFQAGPCGIPGAIGACTVPNGSQGGFVLREFVYQPDDSRIEEFKRSCHRNGKGTWEHAVPLR